MEDNRKNGFNILKNEIGYWVGLISGIVTIICAFKKEIPKWLLITWFFSVGICIVWIAARFLKFLKDSIKSKEQIEEKYKNEANDFISSYYIQMEKICEEIHKYLHNMRNYYNDYANCNDSHLTAICDNICSYIENLYNLLWKNEKVSVCIKRIITNEITDYDYENWRVATIARSSKTLQARYNSNEPLISENSDFKIIISPDFPDTVFSCMDLRQVDDVFFKEYGEKYKNSTPNYLSFYKSTIVVPIQIDTKKANKKIIDINFPNAKFHLVGFLCVDTEDAFSGEEIQFKAGIELAKGCADAIYKIFENNILSNETGKELIVK